MPESFHVRGDLRLGTIRVPACVSAVACGCLIGTRRRLRAASEPLFVRPRCVTTKVFRDRLLAHSGERGAVCAELYGQNSFLVLENGANETGSRGRVLILGSLTCGGQWRRCM